VKRRKTGNALSMEEYLAEQAANRMRRTRQIQQREAAVPARKWKPTGGGAEDERLNPKTGRAYWDEGDDPRWPGADYGNAIGKRKKRRK
jgi:hypothetical protein